MKHRRILIAFSLVVLMAFAMGCAVKPAPEDAKNPPAQETPEQSETAQETPQAAEMDTITMALAAFQDVNSIMVGVEKGFFEEENINLEIIRSDWGGGNELLIGGQVDVACAGDTEAVTQNAVGVDTTLAFPYWYFAGSAFMYDANKFPEWQPYKVLLDELGTPDEAIKACIKQMVDDKANIGLSSGGELPTFIQIIGYGGYTLEDFTVYDMSQEDLPPALFSGSIDVMISGIPQRLAATNEGYVPLLEIVDFPELIAHCGFSARRSWVDENFDLAVRFQKALFKTLDYVENNPDEAFPIIADSLKDAGTVIDPNDLYGVWNIMEYFPSSKEQYVDWTLTEGGKFYWKSRFEGIVNSLEAEEKIEAGSIDRDNLEDLLYAIKVVNAID